VYRVPIPKRIEPVSHSGLTHYNPSPPLAPLLSAFINLYCNPRAKMHRALIMILRYALHFPLTLIFLLTVYSPLHNHGETIDAEK